MQKSLTVIFVPLFLCLLFSAISIYCFDSDSVNSVALNFSTGLNSVMSTKTTKRKLRRVSQDNNENGQDNQTERQRLCSDESFPTVSNMDAHCQRKSQRLKKACQPMMVMEENQTLHNSDENRNACNHRDKRIRSNEQDHGVIVNQMFFADRNSDTNSTTAIVMATKSGKTKMRRVLQDDDAESQNAGEQAKRIPNQQDFTVVSLMDTDCETISIKRRQDCQRRSKRLREASRPMIIEQNQSLRSNDENVTAFGYDQGDPSMIVNDTTTTMGECSHSIGQASYQRTRQVLIVNYEDSGDNAYKCDYCGAYFWIGEAMKQSSANAQLIYTNCCKKGQVKLPQPRPTPNFLKTLLDSKVFKENIRVYNSMFSFTSMGATIDKKINVGSAPCIFKISGQVHHLMDSILPSEGESPKYAQLYIYDTKNEISNHINAIDPTHINQNIMPEIVEGLIKIFDEINDLVKEFRTMRDKFENHSLPSFSMSILNCQTTDSQQYEKPISEDIGGLIVGDIGEHNSNICH